MSALPDRSWLWQPQTSLHHPAWHHYMSFLAFLEACSYTLPPTEQCGVYWCTIQIEIESFLYFHAEFSCVDLLQHWAVTRYPRHLTQYSVQILKRCWSAAAYFKWLSLISPAKHTLLQHSVSWTNRQHTNEQNPSLSVTIAVPKWAYQHDSSENVGEKPWAELSGLKCKGYLFLQHCSWQLAVTKPKVLIQLKAH